VNERLSPREIELVLRRAAELDSRAETEMSGTDGESAIGLTPAELFRLGQEAGLGREAVSRALTDLRTGALENAAPREAGEGGLVEKALGQRRVVVSRVIPGNAAAAQRAVERFLREQLMTIRRHHGDRVEWERAQGVWSGLMRALDFSRRYAFSPVDKVETRVWSLSEHETAVTLTLDVEASRRSRFWEMSLRSALTFALVGLGGWAMLPEGVIGGMASMAGAGSAAAAMFVIERRRFSQARQRAIDASERCLDLFALKRRRSSEPGDFGDL
jgi:hypothetical protein